MEKELYLGHVNTKTGTYENGHSSPRLCFGLSIWNNIQKTDNLNIHIPEFLSKKMHVLLYSGIPKWFL